MSVNRTKPELLAPAGDPEKLKIAVAYGADAVYIGGQAFGLRAKAKNFDDEQMAEGVAYAHRFGVKVYIAANIFAHNTDFKVMAETFLTWRAIGADALIVSDPGVFSVAQRVVPGLPIHISTQANNTNYETALFWRRLGAERIVLARELSFQEIAEIREKATGITLEAFVHGAMCISYSGRCLLSNYMAGRDANKGACAQPCRWQYALMEENRPGEYIPVEEDGRGTYFLNSKDLCMVNYLPSLIAAGVGSLKIEGRMKTPYYVGTVVKAYRRAIDDYFLDPVRYERNRTAETYVSELKKASHRNFTTGFYMDKPNENDQNYLTSAYVRTYAFVGIVLDYDAESGLALIEQRNRFFAGDTVEVMSARGDCFTQSVGAIFTEDGVAVAVAPHARQRVKIKTDWPVARFDLIRKLIVE